MSHPRVPGWLQGGRYFNSPAPGGGAALPEQPPRHPSTGHTVGNPPPSSPPALLPTSLGGRGLPAGVFGFYKNTFCKMDVRKAPTSPPPRELRAAPGRPSLPPAMSEQGPGRRPPRPGRRSQTPTRPACPQRGAGAGARTAGAAGAQPLCAWGSGLGNKIGRASGRERVSSPV